MAVDPVVRPAAGNAKDVTLVKSGPRGVDIYVGPSSPTQLGQQRLDRKPPPSGAPVPVTGTAAVTLANFTSTASGTAGSTFTGTAAVTLDPFTSDASGTETGPITGTAAVTLDGFTSTATGTGGSIPTFTGGGEGRRRLEPIPDTITLEAHFVLDDFTSTGYGTCTTTTIDFDAELEQLLLVGAI